MKILYIHNNYASNNSGEEHAAEGIVNLLRANGHIVDWYRRSSHELAQSFYKKVFAICTGVWNPAAVKQVKEKLQTFKPDVVQVQNLYPLISPAILKAIKKSGIPVVMRCPNYRLFCPNGLHLDPKGQVCEACLSFGREIHCIRKNCEKNWIKSMGYALRNYTARKYWGILKNVDHYIVQSDFQKQKFAKNGIANEKITVVPGLTPEISATESHSTGSLVSFVGRVSVEKGILEFIEAARMLPNISFAIAGGVDSSLLHLQKESTQNITWHGFLKGTALDALYSKSQIIVIPGKWYEGFPNVITRAMMHRKPVITSNLGAMASIIEHERNGLLVEPGNATALAEAISKLHSNTVLCKKYGEKGFTKAQKLYSSEAIYSILMEIYNKVQINLR